LKLSPSSTIGRKLVMAVTGILLIGFLVEHLLGNLLLFDNDHQKYNEYAHYLISNPFIYIAELILLLLFVYHAVEAIVIYLGERNVRPVAYGQSEALGKRTVYSVTMIWTGLILLVFLVIHIATFKYGADYHVHNPLGQDTGVRDLYKLVAEKFRNPLYSGFYVLCMLCLGFHMGHALQSAVRTLGITHRGWLARIKLLSLAIALVFTIGFGSMPIYFFLKGGH